MKNAIILILVLATLGAGYFALKARVRLTPASLEGKTAKLARGDLELPVNATGEIKTLRRIEMKAEASGEVIEIARQAGDLIHAGDLLVRLQPDEEQRSVNRAELDRGIAQARLISTEVSLKQTQTADLVAAKSTQVQIEQNLRMSDFRLKKTLALPPEQRTEEEVLQWETSVKGYEAQLEKAKSDIARIEMLVLQREQELKQAQATLEQAEYILADARKRLLKTDIVAPIEGVVGDIRVQVGEVIQGGKTTLTGGTPLAVVLDLKQLIVRAEVDEADIGRVLAIAPPWAAPGNEGATPQPENLEAAAADSGPLPKITVESFRDKVFTGVIYRIYPEPDTRLNVATYKVDVVIIGRTSDFLLPGMRADVDFTADRVADAVLCPNEAIHEGPKGGLGVYVPDPQARPEERATKFIPCKFGLDNGNYSQVMCEELREGAVVYTRLPVKREEDTKTDRRSRRGRGNAES